MVFVLVDGFGGLTVTPVTVGLFAAGGVGVTGGVPGLDGGGAGGGAGGGVEGLETATVTLPVFEGSCTEVANI